MNGKKYSDNSSNASSGKSKQSSESSTIFDTPEFVIDVYLDAINGGSTTDVKFRSLSGKYCVNPSNYNCNHNPDEGSSCPCNAPKQGACCGEGESPYEKGENHYEELKKDCTSCCGGCENESVYETGKTFHEEVKKEGGCCGCNGESPYAEGETNAIAPKPMPEVKESVCTTEEVDIAQKYPLECNNTNTYAEGESCALCVRD